MEAELITCTRYLLFLLKLNSYLNIRSYFVCQNSKIILRKVILPQQETSAQTTETTNRAATPIYKQERQEHIVMLDNENAVHSEVSFVVI